jgi:putative membrane protein
VHAFLVPVAIVVVDGDFRRWAEQMDAAANSLYAPASGDPALTNAAGVVVGALAVAGASAVVFALMDLGLLSRHMAVHIVAMNVAAPLAAVAWRSRFSRRPAAWLSPAAGLWIATVGQLGLLWAAHSSPVHHLAQSSPFAYVVLQGALFFGALAFWMSVTDAISIRWQAMLALLVSGKFACLLGVLLIFAPRFVFTSPSMQHAGHVMSHAAPGDQAAALADQHLAGLLMIAACPLSYVLTAIIMAAQTLADLERARSPADAHPARRRTPA